MTDQVRKIGTTLIFFDEMWKPMLESTTEPRSFHLVLVNNMHTLHNIPMRRNTDACSVVALIWMVIGYLRDRNEVLAK